MQVLGQKSVIFDQGFNVFLPLKTITTSTLFISYSVEPPSSLDLLCFFVNLLPSSSSCPVQPWKSSRAMSADLTSLSVCVFFFFFKSEVNNKNY